MRHISQTYLGVFILYCWISSAWWLGRLNFAGRMRCCMEPDILPCTSKKQWFQMVWQVRRGEIYWYSRPQTLSCSQARVVTHTLMFMKPLSWPIALTALWRATGRQTSGRYQHPTHHARPSQTYLGVSSYELSDLFGQTIRPIQFPTKLIAIHRARHSGRPTSTLDEWHG